MKRLPTILVPALLLLLAFLEHSAWATAVDVSTPKYGVPPNITTSSNRPMMMLAVSKDHTLFGPIYTDFEDIDDDGTLDTDFKPAFKYYGYFDSTKCYAYSGTNKRFEPAAQATSVTASSTGYLKGSISGTTFTDTTHGSGMFAVGTVLRGEGVIVGTRITALVTGTGNNDGGTYTIDKSHTTSVTNKTIAGTTGKYACSSTSSYWSGNFLNWSGMTRLDVIRKMLYGGRRSTDSTTETVLERAMLNYDAHSFAKYYKGADIRDYTPFTTAALTKTTGANGGNYAGLTICNTGTEDTSTLSSNPPIMRMAIGNYRLWGTVEHQVCRFKDEPTDTSSKFEERLSEYYENTSKGGGGVKHETTLPTRATDGAVYGGLGPELIMRVKVCDKDWLGEERCQAFPPNSTTNYKPYGLFQEFGYSNSGTARAEFGVITGSYDQNAKAGALRKNMGDFADEINSSTGVFCHSASSGCAANLSDGTDTRATGNGAIKAIDNFLLYGRSSLSYNGTDISNLPAWGNPMGEMVVQALQYYAYDGTNPAPTNPSTSTKDTATGLPVVAWTSPLSNTNTTRKSKFGNSICRPMYTLALSSSALTHDGDESGAPFATLNNRAKGSLAAYTDAVGVTEGIGGTTRSIGSVVSATAQGNSCSAKTVGSLSTINGICPEAPAMLGTYLVAGAALYGNTSKIRTITTPPADLAKVKDALKVKTLAASLSGGAARIDILIPGSNPKKYVYLTPESVWGNNYGAPLTFASISSSDTHGAFIVTWNDRLMGGDYDMDLTGTLRYDLIPNSGTASGWDIQVTTDVVAACSGAQGTHGFSIIGVTGANGNGRYLTHQHWSTGVIGSLPSNEGYLCGDTNYRNAGTATTSTFFPGFTFNGNKNDTGACYVNTTGYCTVKTSASNLAIKIRFQMVGVENAVLKDPLWYAAKYGSFTSSTKNADGTFNEVAMPTAVESWDKVRSDGTSGTDGIPDGYFLARRPDLLEDQLRQALDSLAKNSNAAPAVSSSQLISEGLKYVAKFDSTTVEGNIEAYKVDSLGYFSSTPSWQAGQLLQTRTSGAASGDKGNSRNIITNNGNASSAAATTSGGFPFRWPSLPSAYQTLMTSASTNKLSTTNAGLVVDYMRGDQTKESASTGLRVRNDNILGPVVNATPWIQSPPAAYYTESNFPGYRSFATSNKSRAKLLWVSANDGMLHAFNPKADTADGGGSEVFAYVPGPLANRLAEIPLQRGSSGRTRYNGANFTNDTAETLPQGTVWPYVDGSPFTGDVCLTSGSTCSTWKTYTFGTLGRGGKAIFALDTTDLTKLAAGETGTNPADIFKWQFTSDDDNDLGYVVNDVSTSTTSGQASPIVKLNNGKFAIMVGNGQKSTSGKAALFLLFVDGPDASTGSWTGSYVKIVADAGFGNGLSTPTWVDLDGNGTADIAYAGDLKGNMWKFDLTSLTSSKWDVFYKSGSTNKPLITAKDGTTALPITTAPEIVYPPFDGLIVAFGTGNAFESTDFPKNSVTQRIYGVWDRPNFDGMTPARPLPTDLTTLVSRTFARQSDGSVVVSGTPQQLDWASNDGWYVNLPGTSEMVLSDPIMRAGVLTVTSVRPKTTTDNCSDTPSVSLFTFDPLSGKGEKVIQGTTDIAGVVTIIVGRDIDDQKVRTVNDRTIKAHTTECRAGDPGCFCADAGCTKYEKGTSCVRGSTDCFCPTADDSSCHVKGKPTCTAGQSVMRVIGQGTDANLCYTVNARTQWREVPGLRTDQ